MLQILIGERGAGGVLDMGQDPLIDQPPDIEKGVG